MKDVLFTLSVLFFNIYTLFPTWDLQIISDVNADIRMEIVSIPFEGVGRESTNLCNRDFHQIFYGCIHRTHQCNNTFFDEQIVLHEGFSINSIRLASCFSEMLTGTFPVWGFAKYLITFKNLADTNKSIRFYLNCLDSKLGMDTIPGYGYHADFTIWYYGNLATPQVKVCADCGNQDSSIRYVYRNFPFQEVTMWDLFYDRTTPLEKDFKVKTTPFPLSPKASSERVRDIIVGTKVVLDTVLPNLGDQDKYGYNTWIGTGSQSEYPINYYTNPPIPSGNDPGNTFCTPAVYNWFADMWGMKLTATSTDSIILKRNKKLWISGSTPGQNGDTIHFKSGSTLILEPSAEIFTCFGGRLIIDGGANVVWDNHACNFAMDNSALEYNGGTHTVNNGGFMAVGAGGTLKLSDNTTLIFDGIGSVLEIRGAGNVRLGYNSKIIFRNGASLQANGGSFTGINGAVWSGLVFENSGNDSIAFCTFSNSNYYLQFTNGQGFTGNRRVIMNNTFNNGKVSVLNTTNLLVKNNNFNSPDYSGNLFEITNNNIDPSCGDEIYTLVIDGNMFTGGAIQCRLDSYSSSVTPFYIVRNIYTGQNTQGRIGLVAYNIKGSFKNNRFNDNNFLICANLLFSDLDMYGNTIRSKNNNNVWLQSISDALMAPLENIFNQLIWYGGYNKLYQEDNTGSSWSNVYFTVGSELKADRGMNCFSILDTENDKHIIGYRLPCMDYYIRQNSWNVTPLINITCEGPPFNIHTSPVSDCIESRLNIIGTELFDKGFGIYDTLFITNNEGFPGGGGQQNNVKNSSQNEDQILFSTALQQNKQKNYSSAINTLKQLINTKDSSSLLNTAAGELYVNYIFSDTTGNHQIRYDLFTQLKNYLEQKIQQYQNRPSFVEKAYKHYLMCLVKRKNYLEAIAGYENIMNTHHDPVTRLSASWDRAAVILKMQGQGSGETPEKKIPKDIRKLLDNKPAHKIVEEVFTNRKNKSTFCEYTEENVQILNERVTKFNPVSLRDFQEKISQDMAILVTLASSPKNETNITIPKDYYLYQNYPNPFNPVTKIKFGVP